MKIKLIHIVSILAIVVAISVVGWVTLQPKDLEPVVLHKATIPKPRTTNADKTATKSTKEAQMTHIQEMAEGTRNVILGLHHQEEKPKSPYMLSLEKAMNSQAFLEYLEEQSKRSSFSFHLWYDFLESQGVRSGRYVYENRLRDKYNYTEDLSYYEPMMQEQMAKLFLASENPTDKVGVLMQFTAKEENTLWYLAYFGGEGDREWIDEIQRNAANIVASATPEIATPPTQQILTTPSQPTDVTEENLDSEPQPPLFSEDTLSLEDLEPLPQSLGDIQEELLDEFLPDVPEFPTNAEFETALRERFSPQRFNTAMQTLNQYGPKEGLRRLKESDPEVAAQVERLIQRNKETD